MAKPLSKGDQSEAWGSHEVGNLTDLLSHSTTITHTHTHEHMKLGL